MLLGLFYHPNKKNLQLNHTALQCGLVFCIIYDLGFVDFLKEEVGLKTSSIIFKQVQLT